MEDQDTANSYGTIHFRLYSEYFLYYRDAYTILEFLGNVGSLQSALILAGYILVSFFTERLYLSLIMKKLYQTKFDRK